MLNTVGINPNEAEMVHEMPHPPTLNQQELKQMRAAEHRAWIAHRRWQVMNWMALGALRIALKLAHAPR